MGVSASSLPASRVLVIDDDPSSLGQVAGQLRGAGLDVLTASDGPQGLDILARERLDLVVSDVLLPGRDGFDIARTLKANPHTAAIPIILLSPFYLRRDEEGRAVGSDGAFIRADAILSKPAEGDTLLRHVHALLSGEPVAVIAAARPRLLVVDADLEQAELLRARFEPELDLVTAQSGEQALEMAQRHPPSACLISRELPGMGGLELLARLRQIEPEVPIIMVTAHGSERMAVEAMKHGASHYFSKPIDLAEVALVLREGIERRALYARTRRLDLQLRETSGDLLLRIQALEAANARLLESNERIREADRLKSDFIANMSHELRTPLNSIIGFSQLLLADSPGLPATQRADAEAILSCGRHLLSMIDDLLDLARIEAGRLELRPSAFDVREVVGEALVTGKSLLEGRGIDLECRLPEELPCARADRTRVRQVLLNLLANAARVMDRGAITISARKHEGAKPPMLQLSVSDMGPGIPLDQQEAVFERFRQLPGMRKGGIGLGLTISKNLVELMGGRIWVSSVVGAGTTFHFTLKAARERSEL